MNERVDESHREGKSKVSDIRSTHEGKNSTPSENLEASSLDLELSLQELTQQCQCLIAEC